MNNITIACEVLDPDKIIYHAFSDYRAYKLVGNFKTLKEAKIAIGEEKELSEAKDYINTLMSRMDKAIECIKNGNLTDAIKYLT